jgi:hypothetical protein
MPSKILPFFAGRPRGRGIALTLLGKSAQGQAGPSPTGRGVKIRKRRDEKNAHPLLFRETYGTKVPAPLAPWGE